MNETLGKQIRELRKQRGMTQVELAERAGTTQGHIARIECGRYTLTMAVLSRLADALDVELGFIEKQAGAQMDTDP